MQRQHKMFRIQILQFYLHIFGISIQDHKAILVKYIRLVKVLAVQNILSLLVVLH